MEPETMRARQEAYLQILEWGLLAIRNAACAGKTKLCEIEADHIHNLPSLFYEHNKRRHQYYISAERRCYVGRLKELGDEVYLEFRTRLYAKPWRALAAIALPEIEAQNAAMRAKLERRPGESMAMKGSAVSLVVEQVESPTDEVRLLIGELDAELGGTYAPEQRHGLSLSRVFQPGILFFIARLAGEAVGCGGIALQGEAAEVKRMYVRPPARGRGVARAILDRLEAAARARGVSRLTLETGDAQHAAMRFYERAGFIRCGAFGEYARMPAAAIERSVFFEKRIG